VLFLAMVLVIVPQAWGAAVVFDFSYSFAGIAATPMDVTASGQFTATDLLDGSFLVTGITGTWNGAAITGLIPVGAYAGNDNLLFFPAEPYIDISGISYSVSAGGDDSFGDVNIYLDWTAQYTENNINVGYGVFSVSPVPEPAAGILAVSGFLLLSAARFFRRATMS
jgi:hypothetical protein